MNKGELISKLAEKYGACSRAEAERALDSFVDIVVESLTKGEEVAISGFGTFSARARAARQGINPKTGVKIQIPAMRSPKFKAGKGLKDALKK